MRRRLLVRLGALVAGSALLLTGAGVWQPRAEAVDPPGSWVQVKYLKKKQFDLDWNSTPGNGELPIVRTNLTKVFEKANRKARYGRDCRLNATNGPEPRVRWCFKRDDNHTKNWYPQGVSSDADSQQDEEWNGHKGLMVSWYHKGKKGVRVTLLDTRTKKYRHILLVVPTKDGHDYKPVLKPGGGSLHAGGIVWYGRYLYLADTYYGIRVFSLDNIFDLAKDPDGNITDRSKVGYHNGTFYGYKYRYIIPQVGRWENEKPGDPEKPCQKKGALRHSWLSLDRSSKPDRLIAGEYCKSTWKQPGRVVAWNMKNTRIADKGMPDEAFRLPRLRSGDGGNILQGGLKNKYHWFFNSSRGKGKNGVLYKFHPAPDYPSSWKREGTKATPYGPEDLTYRYRGVGNKRLLYSVAEYPRTRIIYARNTYSGW